MRYQVTTNWKSIALIWLIACSPVMPLAAALAEPEYHSQALRNRPAASDQGGYYESMAQPPSTSSDDDNEGYYSFVRVVAPSQPKKRILKAGSAVADPESRRHKDEGYYASMSTPRTVADDDSGEGYYSSMFVLRKAPESTTAGRQNSRQRAPRIFTANNEKPDIEESRKDRGAEQCVKIATVNRWSVGADKDILQMLPVEWKACLTNKDHEEKNHQRSQLQQDIERPDKSERSLNSHSVDPANTDTSGRKCSVEPTHKVERKHSVERAHASERAPSQERAQEQPSGAPAERAHPPEPMIGEIRSAQLDPAGYRKSKKVHELEIHKNRIARKERTAESPPTDDSNAKAVPAHREAPPSTSPRYIPAEPQVAIKPQIPTPAPAPTPAPIGVPKPVPQIADASSEKKQPQTKSEPTQSAKTTAAPSERIAIATPPLMPPLNIAGKVQESAQNKGAQQNKTKSPGGPLRAAIKLSHDAVAKVDQDGTIVLESGDALVEAHSKVRLRIGQAKTAVAENCLVHLSRANGCIKIHNLYDRHASSVTCEIADHKFVIEAGQELACADSFAQLNNSLSTDKIERRCVKTFDLSNGSAILSCEFSPTTLISENELLHQLRKGQSALDKSTFQKVVKMAACLQVATASHGGYAPVGSAD